MADDDHAAWLRRRQQMVAGHAAAQEADRAAEADRGAQLIAGFVRRAEARGLRPTRLTARAVTGRATYRSRVWGWYLKANRSIGVGVDGAFYVLEVPASLRGRLVGVDLQPSAPRLVVGAGGRDGESVPLEVLLQRRLDAGPDWP